MVIGATYAFDLAGEKQTDAAYIYRHDGFEWIEEAKLVPSGAQAFDAFGWAAAINPAGNLTVISALNDRENGFLSGAAFVFRFDEVNGWVEEAKLLPSDGEFHDEFGESVAIGNDVILVGAEEDDDLGENAGAAYVFRYTGSTWVEETKLLASDGHAVDMSSNGEVIAAGARLDDDRGDQSGSVYLFEHQDSLWNLEQKMASDADTSGRIIGHSVALSGDGSRVVAGAPGDGEVWLNHGSAYVFDRALCVPLDSCLHLEVSELRAGMQGQWIVSDSQAGATIAFVYGFGEGLTYIDHLLDFCAAFGIEGVMSDRLIGLAVADQDGRAIIRRLIPMGARGLDIVMQAAMRDTCPGECVSNRVRQVIQ